jgi:hypothetical protein
MLDRPPAVASLGGYSILRGNIAVNALRASADNNPIFILVNYATGYKKNPLNYKELL